MVGMFGAKPVDGTKPAGGLFGALAAPGGGMFGAKPTDAAKPAGNLFGAPAAPGGGIFGGAKPAAGGMFNLGGTPAGKGLFGGAKPEDKKE